MMQTIINICLRKNKSKQSYVWIDSIFEAQSICFGTEKAGLLDFSLNILDRKTFQLLIYNFMKRWGYFLYTHITPYCIAAKPLDRRPVPLDYLGEF